MKTHEETWDERGERIDLCEEQKPYGVVAVKMIATFHCTEGDCTEAARAKLAAAAPDMARLLLELQAVDTSDGEYRERCPSCQDKTMLPPDGKIGTPYDVHPGEHSKDCKLIAVLRKAGVIADKETR
jgi:hypothetical protein